MADFLPTADLETLRRRAMIIQRLRHFFEQHDFLEVETPLLSRDTVVDVHVEPIEVPASQQLAHAHGPTRYWLQTSPEYGMKRLLAAGATAIYQITRAFRAAEFGPVHNPEFTIVEWYRVGDSMLAGIELLDDLAQFILHCGAAERLTYAQAFQRWTGLDPHRSPLERLAEVAHCNGLQTDPPWDPDDRDAWLDWLLVTCVEPNLGQQRPTILFDYPASQAALAQVRPGELAVAERFELYVRGIELANGYHELTDADELVRRAQAANVRRAALGKSTLPVHSRLEAAMRQGLPNCTGVALGLDRLVMVALGAAELSQVMAFPFNRA